MTTQGGGKTEGLKARRREILKREYKITTEEIDEEPPTLWKHLHKVGQALHTRGVFVYKYIGKETMMAWTGFVGGMQSIGYVVMLLLLMMYIYAVAGVIYFGTNDPWHFGSLGLAMVTLTRVVILDAWTQVGAPYSYRYPLPLLSLEC
jgi:hypothetical protein